MYTARFELLGEQWLQACLRLKFCGLVSGTEGAKLLRHLVSGLVDCRCLRFGYRISLAAGYPECHIFVSAKAEDEAQLRRCLASFTRLNILHEGSVQPPQSRQEYDDSVAAFPKYRIPVSIPAYRVRDDLWVACDFNGCSLVDSLFAEAVARGYDLVYHSNFELAAVDPMLRREARRNALRIRSLAGAPESLGDSQELLAKRLDSAPYLVDELFGVSSLDAVNWLRAALQRHFSESYEEWRLEVPEFPADEDAHELSLMAMRHRSVFEELSLQETCSSILAYEDLLDLLSWCPTAEIYRAIGLSGYQQSGEIVRGDSKEVVKIKWPINTPPPEVGDEAPYFFVSYKRGDNCRISPVLQRVVEWGYKIWYDEGIPGGSEWDAVIEDRLEKCQLVLVFVSQEAISSRYVRRELRFADTLRKAIIPVQLEAVEWTHGMGMLLTELQSVDCSSIEKVDKLQTAIKYILER